MGMTGMVIHRVTSFFFSGLTIRHQRYQRVRDESTWGGLPPPFTLQSFLYTFLPPLLRPLNVSYDLLKYYTPSWVHRVNHLCPRHWTSVTRGARSQMTPWTPYVLGIKWTTGWIGISNGRSNACRLGSKIITFPPMKACLRPSENRPKRTPRGPEGLFLKTLF